jgi:hypothetical protein
MNLMRTRLFEAWRRAHPGGNIELQKQHALTVADERVPGWIRDLEEGFTEKRTPKRESSRKKNK